MRIRVLILSRAKEDILAGKRWYNRQREGLGDEFKQMVLSHIEVLRGGKVLHRKVFEETRRMNLARFPYLIYYFFDKPSGTIVILAVLHASRSDKEIKSRI